MKFRKKPVVIEAIQFNGENMTEIHEFAWGQVLEPVVGNFMEVVTLEGTMRASVGDWIIKGVNGEFYPCKNDVFEKTYDLVE